MKVKHLREALGDVPDDLDVVIVDTRFGTIGPSPAVSIRGVSEGFDWDNGRLIIHPEKRMTSVDKETVKSMIAYANQAGWRTQYEKQIAELTRQLERNKK